MSQTRQPLRERVVWGEGLASLGPGFSGLTMPGGGTHANAAAAAAAAAALLPTACSSTSAYTQLGRAARTTRAFAWHRAFGTGAGHEPCIYMLASIVVRRATERRAKLSMLLLGRRRVGNSAWAGEETLLTRLLMRYLHCTLMRFEDSGQMNPQPGRQAGFTETNPHPLLSPVVLCYVPLLFFV